MKIDDALISKLEKLAKLKLSAEESEKLKQDLDKIIDMFSLISEVDTEGIEPLRHLNDEPNRWRDDVPSHQLSLDDIRKVAPKIIDNQFAVPRVIE